MTEKNSEKITTPTNEVLNSIMFVDDNIGIAVGGTQYLNSAILRTSDAGQHWYEDSVYSFPTKLFNRAIKYENRIYVCGEDGHIIHSLDSGRSWQWFQSYHWPVYKDIEYFHPDTGWVVGVKDRNGIIVKINSYGEEYSFQEIHTPLFTIHRLDEKNIIVGGSGIILYSDNGGDSFEASDADGDYFIRLLEVDTSVYAVGRWGSVLRSEDHGKHWTKLQRARNGKINAIGARDAIVLQDGRMAIVGDNGLLRLSNDGWSSFEDIDIGYSNHNFLSICQKSNGLIWISGNDGLILANISI